VAESSSIEELLQKVKTKRYALARLRRMLMRIYLGLDRYDSTVPYLRVLACNETGRALLKEMKTAATLPVITKPADLPCTPAAARQQALQSALCDLYTLALPTPRDAAFYLRAHPYLAPDEAF
jgi:hypothetical protein